MTAFLAWEGIKGIAVVATAVTALNGALGTTAALATAAYGPLAAIAAIAAGGLIGGAALNSAINTVGPTSEAGKNMLNQATAPGMGVPGASRDPIFQPTAPNIPGGGGPNASRERRGLPPAQGLIGGAFSGPPSGVIAGAGGQGFPIPTTSGGLIGGSGNAAQARPAAQSPYSGNKGAVYRAMIDAGFPASDFQMLDYIVMNESQYRTTATNPVTGDWGIPQFNPAAGNIDRYIPNRSTDPYVQGTAMMRYIKDRYGTMDAAYQFKLSHGWYDNGGWLPPGATVVHNDTGKPELILNPDQQQQLTDNGVDPNTLIHGSSNGAAPGPTPDQAQMMPDSANRTQGFVPVAAGNTGVAGTSTLSHIIGLGNEVVGGLIDTGASVAQTAISAAITAGAAGGTMGGAAAAGPAAGAAASYGIQLGAAIAKRASSFGFQLASIGADSLVEQLFPLGAPRWLGYDYTQFIPQMGIQPALTTTLEKAGQQAIYDRFGLNPDGTKPQQPGGPVSPETMPGVSAPVPGPPGPDAPPPPAQDSGPSVNNPMPTGNPELLKQLGVFDQGGMLPPGGIGVNLSRRPEPVLTSHQWDAMTAAMSNPSGSGPLVKIDNIYGMSPDDVANKIEAKQKLAMMRYAGRP